MKHASASTLQVLEPLLVALRTVPALVERRPGTFYFRSAAFLHFHEDPLGNFADVKLDLRQFSRFPVGTRAEQQAVLRLCRATIEKALSR